VKKTDVCFLATLGGSYASINRRAGKTVWKRRQLSTSLQPSSEGSIVKVGAQELHMNAVLIIVAIVLVGSAILGWRGRRPG
jgi:hypothetical protein